MQSTKLKGEKRRRTRAQSVKPEGAKRPSDGQVGFPAQVIYSFFMMMVEQRTAAQASAKRKHPRGGMNAANVGASHLYLVNKPLISCQTHCPFSNSNLYG